jgi:hypothetical protein
MDSSTRELSPTFALVTGIPDLGLWPVNAVTVQVKSLAWQMSHYATQESSLERPPNIHF